MQGSTERSFIRNPAEFHRILTQVKVLFVPLTSLDDGGSAYSSSYGYGGYANKQEEATGISGYAKNGVGAIVSGASSIISSGLSYIKGGQQPVPKSGMMGFGSEDLQRNGGHYNPPGGSY